MTAWIALGAALGGLLRFGAEYLMPPVGTRAFPRATLAVNLAGSFVIGAVQEAPHTVRTIVAVGVCGALTTFSGVSLQAHRRIIAGATGDAVTYVAGSVAGCCVLAWVGTAVAGALAG